MEEYQLQPSNKVMIMSGSKTSGGFSIVKIEKLINSLAYIFGEQPELTRYIVHSYYREEGDILQTVRDRFDILAKLINRDLPDTKLTYTDFEIVVHGVDAVG